MSVTVKNPTASPIYATEDGISYEILPGKSVEVDARTAMILGEYGAIVDRDAVDTALLEADGRLDVDYVGEREVERVSSPFSEHGPGVNATGQTVNPDAVDAFAAAVQGDTSKTPGKVAALRYSDGGVVDPSAGVTVSSESGVTSGDVAPAADKSAIDVDLEAAGLSTSGTAKDKRARLAEHRAQ